MKKMLNTIAAGLLLLLGVWMNLNSGEFAMKAIIIPQPWEAIVFIVLAIVVCFCIVAEESAAQFVGLGTMVVIMLYYLGSKIPFAAINEFLNNMHRIPLKLISIVMMLGAVVWIMLVHRPKAKTGGA